MALIGVAIVSVVLVYAIAAETPIIPSSGTSSDAFPISSSNQPSAPDSFGVPPTIRMSSLPNIGETAIVEITFTNPYHGITEANRPVGDGTDTVWYVTSGFEIVDAGGQEYWPSYDNADQLAGYEYAEFTSLATGETKTYRIEVRAVEEGQNQVYAQGYFGSNASILLYLDDKETMLYSDYLELHPETDERPARGGTDERQRPPPLTEEELSALQQTHVEQTKEDLMVFITDYVRNEQLSIDWVLDNLLPPHGDLSMTDIRQVLAGAGYADSEIDEAMQANVAARTPTSIEAGWWAGECLGRCNADMALTSGTVVYHADPGLCQPDCTEISRELPLSGQEWDRLVGLLDLEKFNALPDTIGSPGETDSPIWHIKISSGGESKRVSFEVPEDLPGNEEFGKALRDMLGDLMSKHDVGR